MAFFDASDFANISNYGAVVVVAVFMVKEFFGYLRESKKVGNGNGNGSSVIKLDLGPLHQKLDQLLKSDVAGQKSSEWWELTFARIVKQCLDEHENRINRPIIEDAAQSRQELLEGQKALERQVAMAVAELSRQIRDNR